MRRKFFQEIDMTLSWFSLLCLLLALESHSADEKCSGVQEEKIKGILRDVDWKDLAIHLGIKSQTVSIHTACKNDIDPAPCLLREVIGRFMNTRDYNEPCHITVEFIATALDNFNTPRTNEATHLRKLWQLSGPPPTTSGAREETDHALPQAVEPGPPPTTSGAREETDHALPQAVEPGPPGGAREKPDRALPQAVHVEPGEDFDFDLENHRGIAVLITCDYNGTLSGTNRDADEMMSTFDQLDYQVFQKLNVNAKRAEIVNLLRKLSIYLSQYEDDDMEGKVLIFAFSGHGGRDNQIVTYDHKNLSIMDDIVPRFVENHNVFPIPKLFFIDACRGGERLTKVPEFGLIPKGWVHMEGKYHISYATIDEHVAYDGNWMHLLAQKIRSSDDSLQNIVADVSGMTPLYQQSESVDRLRGRFYFKERPATPSSNFCTLL